MCAQRVNECLPDPSVLTSPPCQCIWGEIQGKTDNPAKIWNESSANRRDSASTNLDNHLYRNTCTVASEQEEEREDSISTRFMVGDLSAYCKGQYATRSKNTTRSPSPNRASPLRRFSEKQRTTTLPRPQRQRVGLFCGLGGYHAHVASFAVRTGCTALHILVLAGLHEACWFWRTM